MTKVIFAEDQVDCEDLLGTFLDESHYDILVEEDCDFYAPKVVNLFGEEEVSEEWLEENTIFKFRKGFFSKEEQQGAYDGLAMAAGESQNRGLAAGTRNEKLNNRDWVTERQIRILELLMNPKDSVFDDENELEDLVYDKVSIKEHNPRGIVWLTSKTKGFDFDEWAKEIIKNDSLDERKAEAERVSSFVSNTTYANPVYSGIAGWFDRYPRIPYGRATTYTRDNFNNFKKAYPFLQKLAVGFKSLMPLRYAKQEGRCSSIDRSFYVPETPFTTITVNKTFRTAAHRDAGDLAEGFSNLSVISNGADYKGGYLILPEFKVAVNIRPGDLLLVANHSGIHGNTPIVIEDGGERVSIVCYFREKMLELGEKEYEDLRYEFVESRRLNKDHPLWRPLWNGISPNCFSDNSLPNQDWAAAEDWYNFLSTEKPEFLKKYHPWLLERKGLYEE